MRVKQLQSIVDAFATQGVKPAEAAALFDQPLRATIAKLAETNATARTPATLIALWWNDPKALASARSIIASNKSPAPLRSELVNALGQSKDPANVEAFGALVVDTGAPILIRKNAVTALGSMNDAGGQVPYRAFRFARRGSEADGHQFDGAVAGVGVGAA